jgi:hypothetical protein
MVRGLFFRLGYKVGHLGEHIMKLSHDDIITAIGFFLEAQGASADVGTLEFKIGPEGLYAELEGEPAEEEAEPAPPVEEAEPAPPVECLSHAQMLSLVDQLNVGKTFASVARASRECADTFTGDAIVHGEELVWIEGVGVTRAPLEKWPAELREKLKLEPSEGQTAADVLGGGGGVLDRSAALSSGIRKG